MLEQLEGCVFFPLPPALLTFTPCDAPNLPSQKNELVVQGGTLVPQQGNQLEEEVRQDGGPCPQCGLEWLCELVLVRGKDEEGQGLGDSDDRKDLPFQEEGRGGLEDVPHRDKWVDEKSVEKHGLPLLTETIGRATGWVFEDIFKHCVPKQESASVVAPQISDT